MSDYNNLAVDEKNSVVEVMTTLRMRKKTMKQKLE